MAVISQLGRYRYISELGSGGMSTVVLAEDTVLGRLVALKQVEGTGNVRGASRLRREALIGASVSHPNLVSIFDVITTGDRHMIVMEYVEGETLRDALKRSPRPSVPRVLNTLDGVAAALDAIHERRIIHRDVKPSNILLGKAGEIKLADLGIAAAPDRTRITTSGAILGTFRYMAPEQLEGGPAMPAVDVYALAAVAFEALSGRKARTEPNPVALAHAIATRPPPDLRDAWPEAPREAARVLKRSMARVPSERPQSASELTRRLRAALESKPTVPMTRAPRRAAAPRPAPPPRRRPAAPPTPRSARDRRPALVAAALLIVLAGVIAALALASGGGSPHKRAAGAPARRNAGTRRGTAAGAGRSPRSITAAHGSQATGAHAARAVPAATALPAATPGPTTAGSPVATTESFYHLAASHQYSTAWALADPTFRYQLGGYQNFVGGQSGDRSITFDSARVLSQSSSSATVAVRTTSVRTDGTKRCSGTVDLVPGGSAGWLLHQIHIDCS